MHILFCLDYYYPHIGGAEILFQYVAEGLVRAGHQVDVLTQLVGNADDFENHNGVRIYRVNTLGSRYLFPICALSKLYKLAKQADMLHTSTFSAALPAWVIARLCHKKVTLTAHELWIGKWDKVSDAGWFSNRVNDLAERLIYWPSYDHYIAVSHATESDLLEYGIPAEKVSVIYNGVDYAHWSPDKYDGTSLRKKLCLESQFIFVFSGRPGRSKGLPILLRAFAQLGEDKTQLVVIASKSKACRAGYDEACRLVDELNIGAQVLFQEPLPYDELPSWIAMADCVCVPSLSEGFGFCAAEACAMGRPVIATNNASLPEVVGGRYLLVPPANVEAFALAMKRAMQGAYETRPCPLFLQENNVRAYLELFMRQCGCQEKTHS